jgi:hypothetical protein
MKIFVLLALSLLCSCSFVERRTYSRTDDPSQNWKDYVYNKRGPIEREAMRELNLSDKSSLSEFERYQVDQRVEVKKLESDLRSPTELEQYFKHKPFFKNDGERIHFLRLSDVYQKQAWLEKNIRVPRDKFSPEMETAIQKGDLLPNMTKDAVIKSWGKPEDVEVSGNPAYGNERWTYTNFGDNNANDYQEKRHLFFENGVLKGWKTSRN